MLAGGEEWRAGEQIRIPQRQLAGLQRLHRVVLPLVVLQNQVVEQRVLRLRDAELRGRRAKRLILEEVVNGQLCVVAEGDREEEREGQQQQHGDADCGGNPWPLQP